MKTILLEWYFLDLKPITQQIFSSITHNPGPANVGPDLASWIDPPTPGPAVWHLALALSPPSKTLPPRLLHPMRLRPARHAAALSRVRDGGGLFSPTGWDSIAQGGGLAQPWVTSRYYDRALKGRDSTHLKYRYISTIRRTIRVDEGKDAALTGLCLVDHNESGAVGYKPVGLGRSPKSPPHKILAKASPKPALSPHGVSAGHSLIKF